MAAERFRERLSHIHLPRPQVRGSLRFVAILALASGVIAEYNWHVYDKTAGAVDYATYGARKLVSDKSIDFGNWSNPGPRR